jgi:hypothetical protein
MKKFQIAFLAVVFFALTTAAANAAPKHKNDSGRSLSGKVLDHHDRPVANSVVYLTNTRTRVVKSYIVAADGEYHFPALAPNVDYEVYAQYKGQKGETKTMSQFDDRPEVSINLRIDIR